MTACDRRWNHNLHYYPVLLDAVPDGCQRALDIGCGEGTLARELRRFVRHVSAIDVDEPSIELARRHDPASDIQYWLGDFLAFPFEPASFDFVVSVAALHHMNAVAALQRMHELLRPGGKLAVLGLARSQYPADLPRNVAATLVSRANRATRNYWESSAPTVWPPPETYAEMRRLAECTLPQVRFRRHLLWRYSLILTKSAP
jgi:2-polyprenyl-3-methyl-5-hydroxy-6-metoxy-1,4-benzoquinol methylase